MSASRRLSSEAVVVVVVVVVVAVEVLLRRRGGGASFSSWLPVADRLEAPSFSFSRNACAEKVRKNPFFVSFSALLFRANLHHTQKQEQKHILSQT